MNVIGLVNLFYAHEHELDYRSLMVLMNLYQPQKLKQTKTWKFEEGKSANHDTFSLPCFGR